MAALFCDSTNRVVYSGELVDSMRASGHTYDEARERVEAEIHDRYECYIGIVNGINYDSKNDRYVLKFDMTSTVKVSNEVAEFLMAEGRGKAQHPVVYAHMYKGEVTGVLLRFLSR